MFAAGDLVLPGGLAMPASVSTATPRMSVRAYIGDAKTLLAYDLLDASTRDHLAGFTIQTKPGDHDAYYLLNSYYYEFPQDHAQDDKDTNPKSSVNAPLHKFRWLHVPGKDHQGRDPFRGSYTYTVTARFFDERQDLLPLDAAWSVSVTVDVVPFVKQNLTVAFTRGFLQSQAFERHFGLDGDVVPRKGSDLLFDTSTQAGDSKEGKYSFLDEWKWSGFTVRERVFAAVQAVRDDPALFLDVSAFDLDEPDLLKRLLELAADGRVRVILDNSSEHHADPDKHVPEDEFEILFKKARAGNDKLIKRGHFTGYAHDKIMVVRKGIATYEPGDPVGTVLTGSTNFSMSGMYVNANHVLVFEGMGPVTSSYAALFQAAWDSDVDRDEFLAKPAVADRVLAFAEPDMTVTFAPHSEAFARATLQGLADRIAVEGAKQHGGSVLFAVMSIVDPAGPVPQVDDNTNHVYRALQEIHANTQIVSYGVSDAPDGVQLYVHGAPTGILATGKPGPTKLPPPFDQIKGMRWHQIHHKFVVCGFNGDDPVVYCGSSNLALGGEQHNGDNLLEIHDEDVATAFAIEALSLVDHFATLDRDSVPKKGTPPPAPAPYPYLHTDAGWSTSYFDPNDLRCHERLLFA
jgi:hypothetical protein